MPPSSGQGAVNTLQDAVILANCPYEMTAATPAAIIDAFKNFKDQRHPHVLSQYIANITILAFADGQRWWEHLMRHILFNYLSEFIHQKNHCSRPSLQTTDCFLTPGPQPWHKPCAFTKTKQEVCRAAEKATGGFCRQCYHCYPICDRCRL